MWDIQLHSIILCGNQKMIWKVGVCSRQQRQKLTVFWATIVVLKQGHIQY